MISKEYVIESKEIWQLGTGNIYEHEKGVSIKGTTEFRANVDGVLEN